LGALNTLRDDRGKEMAPLIDLQNNIAMIRSYASNPDPLAAQQLQAVLANVASTKVRAQAELNKYGNYGDLPTRFFGAISKMATGEYTKAQLEQALALADRLESVALVPAVQEINDYYDRVARFGELPPSLVGRGMDRKQKGGSEQPQGSEERPPLSSFKR
jgi:hypothetical protein